MALYLKALHIIFVVTWFAGLFYIVRLFIYHTESQARPDSERKIVQEQFKIMERRLWYGITWPSAILTLITGYWMGYELFGFNFPAWLWAKLGAVAVLFAYHLYCGVIYNKLRKNIFGLSSRSLRMFNELATLLLVSIVFLVVLKNGMDVLAGISGFVLLALLLFAAIKFYGRSRTGK